MLRPVRAHSASTTSSSESEGIEPVARRFVPIVAPAVSGLSPRPQGSGSNDAATAQPRVAAPSVQRVRRYNKGVGKTVALLNGLTAAVKTIKAGMSKSAVVSELRARYEADPDSTTALRLLSNTVKCTIDPSGFGFGVGSGVKSRMDQDQAMLANKLQQLDPRDPLHQAALDGLEAAFALPHLWSPPKPQVRSLADVMAGAKSVAPERRVSASSWPAVPAKFELAPRRDTLVLAHGLTHAILMIKDGWTKPEVQALLEEHEAEPADSEGLQMARTAIRHVLDRSGGLVERGSGHKLALGRKLLLLDPEGQPLHKEALKDLEAAMEQPSVLEDPRSADRKGALAGLLSQATASQRAVTHTTIRNVLDRTGFGVIESIGRDTQGLADTLRGLDPKRSKRARTDADAPAWPEGAAPVARGEARSPSSSAPDRSRDKGKAIADAEPAEPAEPAVGSRLPQPGTTEAPSSAADKVRALVSTDQASLAAAIAAVRTGTSRAQAGEPLGLGDDALGALIDERGQFHGLELDALANALPPHVQSAFVTWVGQLHHRVPAGESSGARAVDDDPPQVKPEPEAAARWPSALPPSSWVERDRDMVTSTFVPMKLTHHCDVLGEASEWTTVASRQRGAGPSIMVRGPMRYDPAHENGFPLRSIDAPHGVHERYAGPDGGIDPRVKVNGLRMAGGSGMAAMRDLLLAEVRGPHKRLRVRGTQQLNAICKALREDITAELNRLIAGAPRTAPRYRVVEALEAGQLQSHEQALIGQRGLIALEDGSGARSQPTARHGRILGVFSGALIETKREEEVEKALRPDMNDYAVDVGGDEDGVTVSPQAYANGLAYANAPIDADALARFRRYVEHPHEFSEPVHLAFDQARVNALFLPFAARMTTNVDGQEHLQRMTAVVGLDNLFGADNPHRHVWLDYGATYLALFEAKIREAMTAPVGEARPQVKQEPSRAGVPAAAQTRRPGPQIIELSSDSES